MTRVDQAHLLLPPRAVKPLRTVCFCGVVLIDVPEDARGVSTGACSVACWTHRAELAERQAASAEVA